MRLRLSIRRNGLPETNIIWSVDMASSTTVYQLLEQVNEVVPIESDDKWGLEDYAVEIRGEKDLNYECLHFQYVTSVLKEDDEVITRRVSGRTQITADGRRLFDGVPWGRPLLRTVTNRPTIEIRPRNARNLAHINYEDTKGRLFTSLNEISDRKTQIHLLYSAFPTSSLAICKYVLDGTNGNMNEAWEALSIGFSASKNQDEIIRLASKNDRKSICRETGSKPILSFNNSHFPNLKDKISKKKGSSRSKNYTQENHDQNRISPVSLEAVNSVASIDVIDKKTDDFLDCRKRETKLSRKENPSPSLETTESSQNVNSRNKYIAENFTPTEASMNENSSYVFSSSVSSDESKIQTDVSSDSSSSNDDSSSDSSDDEVPDESSSKSKVIGNHTSTNSKSTQPATRINVVPGKGKRATQMRNKRRRISNAMKRLKEKGIIPADISKDDFMDFYEKKRPFRAAEQKCTSDESNLVCNKSQIMVNGDDEFKRRRKELLDSLASGGIEVHSDLPRQETSPTLNAQLNTSEIEPESIAAKTGASEIDAKQITITAGSSELTALITLPETVSSKKELKKKHQNTSQRARLDLDAGRRMLFSAIGLKPPVTKQDEENIRKEIMKDSNTFISKKETSTETNGLELEAEDPEAWKEKIIYRAKECVEKNVELCEPPFPFFQRWDPQQKTRKRKANHQIQTQNGLDYDLVIKRQKKDQVNKAYNDEQHLHEDLCESDQLNLQTDDGLEQGFKFDSSTVKENLDDCVVQMQDEDLVPLPNDPSSLPDLKEGEAKTSMVILFKQLEVSAASRWQPQVSSYRRATILSVENDRIQVKLAQLDLQTYEKLYDEQGQRVYHGFETIEIDETEDDGLRDLHFNELIQPKILNPVEEDPIMSQSNLVKHDGIKSANS
ncbi:putative clumping factor b protein [Golovinomyces cichoracearum]|uniref:Putative clumping factor b protein n=1 Tax=Golovinomyces cichoracearum TaxID=62708 RepID=A0A420IN05_9PEZI|nr:putative clumping factor b protein [Golovinomyces cichoracearum]